MLETPDKPSAPLLCPVCGKAMKVQEKYYCVEIEVCEDHGLWLDPSKMKNILKRAIEDFELYWSKARAEGEREARHGWFGFQNW